jgi:hypothetical protein
VCSNQEIFQTNSSVNSINTRNKHYLRRPNANLSCFKKSAFCAAIRILKSLLHSLSILVNDKANFEVALKCTFLLHCRLSFCVKIIILLCNTFLVFAFTYGI